MDTKKDTSMNIIYNEFINIYNFLKNKDSHDNITEGFTDTRSNIILPEEIKNEINRSFTGFGMLKEMFPEYKKYIITFTIDELYDTILFFDFKVIDLSKEQLATRKKVLTNIYNLLILFKESNDINKILDLKQNQLIEELNRLKSKKKELEDILAIKPNAVITVTRTTNNNGSNFTSTNTTSYKDQIKEIDKSIINQELLISLYKPNMTAYHKTLKNTIILYLNEINDIENNENDIKKIKDMNELLVKQELLISSYKKYNNYYIIIIIILILIAIGIFFNSNKKKK